MKWQPIETAPRDGQWFVAARFEEGYDPHYEVGAYCPLQFPKFELDEATGLYRRHYETAYEWEGFNNMPRMTHWTPLPAPPEAR